MDFVLFYGTIHIFLLNNLNFRYLKGQDGLKIAEESIASGAPMKVLKQLIYWREQISINPYSNLRI